MEPPVMANSFTWMYESDSEQSTSNYFFCHGLHIDAIIL